MAGTNMYPGAGKVQAKAQKKPLGYGVSKSTARQVKQTPNTNKKPRR